MKKMKKLTALFASGLSFLLLSPALNAKLTADDQGVYLRKNQAGEILAAYGMVLADSGKYWYMTTLENQQWKKVGCSETRECRMTQSFPPTLKRFFAKHPDILKIIDKKFKALSISCVDAKPFAFCRLDEPNKATYLLVTQDSQLAILEKHQQASNTPSDVSAAEKAQEAAPAVKPAQPAQAKPAQAAQQRAAQPKPAQAKPAQAAQQRAAQPKPAQAKPAQAKPTQAAQQRPVQSKPTQPKPAPQKAQ